MIAPLSPRKTFLSCSCSPLFSIPSQLSGNYWKMSQKVYQVREPLAKFGMREELISEER
jgi:hypothetical protein